MSDRQGSGDETVIARADHGVSRKDISPNALRVLYKLRDAGFEAYIVGGAVRDLLIGGHPKDFDVATNATPDQVRAQFRNCRLIGRRFRLAHIMFGQEIIEVATFRASGDDDTAAGDRQVHEEGHLIRDNVYGTLEEDAFRRDFTANALYYTVEDFSVRDIVGGYADVQARVLRLIGDPVTRYREDPVRMLRAVRLAAKLDFSIHASAAEPIPELAGLLASSSSARLFDECLKIFLAGSAEKSFLLLERFGLLDILFPDTAKALQTNRTGTLRDMLLESLRQTDARVNADKSVAPGFLFACLLWPAYCRELAILQNSGAELSVAQQRAADRVTLRQLERVAIPRRFSLPMHEIWQLQTRFNQRTRKRVFRLLAHPRFRAAFDFLALRATGIPELAEELQFWEQAQNMAPEQLAQSIPGQSKPSNGESAHVPPKRRRRRSKPKSTDG
ncbi:polynucleotide adenylyltransferase PcnB [Arenimonas sp.]|jgi:poly(A) polymerase|uniref:polynucleotide adenylyltransferase PcnB n=1 Tax=Arenimonas sp. TaxID=1872635 RepID=UPI0037BF939A